MRAQLAILTTLQVQITTLQGQVERIVAGTRTLRSICPHPVWAVFSVLGEFGDDPHCYAGARAGKSYAGTSPITRQSGKKKTVHARHVHHDRLLNALNHQAQSALNTSPGARAYYDQQRDRGGEHSAALRQLANRLVGILHGYRKTRTCYDKDTAWPPTTNEDQQIAT